MEKKCNIKELGIDWRKCVNRVCVHGYRGKEKLLLFIVSANLPQVYKHLLEISLIIICKRREIVIKIAWVIYSQFVSYFT